MLLVLLLFTFSLYLIELFFVNVGFIKRVPSLMLISYPTIFAIGPLIFLYSKKLLELKISNHKRIIIISIPIIIYLSFIPYYLLDGETKINWYWYSNNTNYLSHIKFFLQKTFFIIYTFIFLFFTLIEGRNKLLGSKKTDNKITSKNYKWFKIFVLSFIILLIIELNFILFFEKTNALIFTLFLALFIHFFIYSIIINPEFFFDLKTNLIKYRNSPITPSDASKISTNFIQYLEVNKPYLNDSFDLKTAATHLNIPKHYLSQAISQNLKSSFSKIIKEYRIKESINLLIADHKKERKIIDIAFDSGFKDISNFYRTFKELKGITPSSFRDKNI